MLLGSIWESPTSLCMDYIVRSYHGQQLYTTFHKLNCKSKYIIYLMECALCQVQYVGKAETTFSIRLTNHKKYVSNPKSVPAELHFRKPEDSFTLNAKFISIELLSNIPTINKDILKFRLKQREYFWIKKLETLPP